MHKIAIVAPGAMGSAVAARLTEGGATILTLLEGRSEVTKERARQAGMQGVTPQDLVEADFLLSILPPAHAVALAEQLAPVLERSARKPVYVDCNAIDVATVRRVGEIIGAVGARFLDGAIIGSPPKPGEAGPMLHLAGDWAGEVAALERFGLRTKIVDGPVGAASALKMAYAGINKGFTGLAAAMVLAATRAGAASALHAELQASRPQFLQLLGQALPDMLPKAYRWVAEMREIAAFAGEDEAVARLYVAMADFYEGIAADQEEALSAFEAFLETNNAD